MLVLDKVWKVRAERFFRSNFILKNAAVKLRLDALWGIFQDVLVPSLLVLTSTSLQIQTYH